MSDDAPTVAILGGTGKLGGGLALRWALAGVPVVIGSRDAARASAAAEAIAVRAPDATLTGLANRAAAEAGEIVVLAVPYEAHAATLAEIAPAVAGKIVVDATVPLAPPRVSRVQLPEGRAAALEAQAALGEGVRVVAAFQNVAAAHVAEPGHEIACDVLVCGDDRAARAAVIGLAARAGMRALHAGPLANAVAVEALTPLLIWINRDRKVSGAGIRITGLGDDA